MMHTVYKRTGFDVLPIFTGGNKSLRICHLRCYHSKSTFILITLASFSIACISCPAGADIRSPGIGAVGI